VWYAGLGNESIVTAFAKVLARPGNWQQLASALAA